MLAGRRRLAANAWLRRTARNVFAAAAQRVGFRRPLSPRSSHADRALRDRSGFRYRTNPATAGPSRPAPGTTQLAETGARVEGGPIVRVDRQRRAARVGADASGAEVQSVPTHGERQSRFRPGCNGSVCPDEVAPHSSVLACLHVPLAWLAGGASAGGSARAAGARAIRAEEGLPTHHSTSTARPSRQVSIRREPGR